MTTELFTEKRSQIRNWMWRQRLERSSYSHAGLIGNAEEMTLLLGLRGGGVDFLSSMIAQPGMPVRYYHNHVSRFEPKIHTSNSPDRLAMPYHKDLPKDHPIMRALRMTMELRHDEYPEPTNRLENENWGDSLCLVKESRGLLAAEAILRCLNCRMLLYVSDPVKIVDRLFDEEGLESAYLVEEGRSVLAPYFLSRFLRRNYGRVLHVHQRIRRTRDLRKRTILHRILVVALIQHMFRMLAARYPEKVTLAEYDQLAFSPVELEGILTKAFDERVEDLGRRVVLDSSFRPDGKDYLVWRNVWPEKTIVSGYLTPEEVRLSYQVLRDSGLATRIAEQSRYHPVTDQERLNQARIA